MKILLWPVHYLPLIGGLEIMTHSLALQLKKMGHDPLVITNHFDTTKFKEFSIEGICVHSFPFTPALQTKELPLIKAIFERIYALFDLFEPEVVNIHGWFECFSFFQTRVLQNRKRPFCLTIHGLLEQNHYNTISCTQLWSEASAITAVSHAITESLAKYQLSHPQIQTIYNGLPAPTSSPLPLTWDPPTLVMVGRLTTEKCFDIAFRAVKQLIHKYPTLKLILVGGGPEYTTLANLRVSLQLEASIVMTDFVPPHEVQKYLDQATIVLVPSYYESFSLVALHAAQRARPVIASEVYGLKEVIEHGKTGLLIPPNEPGLLAEAVDQLLSDPKAMEKMGKAAMKRALSLFTIEKTAQNYVSMYRKILEPQLVPC